MHMDGGDLPAARTRGARYDAGPMHAVFKADGAETGDRYCVSEWWLEAGEPGPGPHAHEANEELFYVVEGTMSFLAGAEWIEAARGSFLRIPAGIDARLREPQQRACRRAERVHPGRLRDDDAADRGVHGASHSPLTARTLELTRGGGARAPRRASRRSATRACPRSARSGRAGPRSLGWSCRRRPAPSPRAPAW